MHPYTAARMMSTIGALHDREVDLNLVVGGYKPDLRALGSLIGKDQRYDRLVEYGRVMAALLDQGPDDRLAFEGEHYELSGAQVFPPLPPGLRSRTFLAGASQAAVRAAEALGATRLAYLGELGADDDADFAGTGVRFGVIARETGDEAWRTALKRYPSRPAREAVRVLAGTESGWLRKFWRDSQDERPERDVYWMRPFEQSRDFCPFLVGSYDEVGELLHRYLRAGVTTLILNVPHDEDDLFHTAAAVRRTEELAVTGRAG
ncbi:MULTISPECIES: LLM class flavin-dependent oxidoreductase [Actinosynnema]|uniref:LLM class flavin-dependent oxidoreductase n=1 Tax=Actinosynnema TaxID=40566 RepID=UPI0020A3034C|nr:LLM class flavin-dependent oxidoreductase [Actinosynnema pretiosum]MCP2097804.1 alkanesulfonate monooxygenase [Actinosynnema pretiosum]